MTSTIGSRHRASSVSRAIVESLESRRLLSAVVESLGIWIPGTGRVKLDYNDSGATSAKFKFGQAGDQMAAGNFAGNTIFGLADYRAGTWFISDNADGVVNQTVQFGTANDIALAGDITGNGYADLVTYSRAGVWKVYDPRQGKRIAKFTFSGQAGAIPLLGDFNGDGKDDLALYEPDGTWDISFDGDGKTDETFHFGGAAGDVPVVADFNGDSSPDLGIFNNGSWKFDENYDGITDATYTKGAAGDVPLAGYFNTANSIFVQAGASDGNNGSINSPVGTIAKAVSLAQSGSIIRIAPGDYPENLQITNTSNLTFVGAGQLATHVDPPTQYYSIFLAGDTNFWFYDMNVAGGNATAGSQGDGFILQGSSVTLRGISTTGSEGYGLLAGAYNNLRSTLDARYSHFDQSVDDQGMILQDAIDATLINDTFNDNGTDSNKSDITQSPQGGYGLFVEGSASATIKNSEFNSNYNAGMAVGGNATANVMSSQLSHNVNGDGALIEGSPSVKFKKNTFASNGTIRNVAQGLNGLEFLSNSFDGTGVVVKNLFQDNTGFGAAVGGGNATLTGNTFNGNTVGMLIYGDNSEAASATITGNSFIGAQSTDEGIFGEGPNASATIGGNSTATENTFENLFIGIDDAKGPNDTSDAVFMILTNNFTNVTNNVIHR